eukprot:3167146-Rhodomonas_salina.2
MEEESTWPERESSGFTSASVGTLLAAHAAHTRQTLAAHAVHTHQTLAAHAVHTRQTLAAHAPVNAHFQGGVEMFGGEYRAI